MKRTTPYTWDFDRSTFSDKEGTRTFSIGVYQWIPTKSGGLKKSGTVRVRGFVVDASSVYAKAEELCHRLNAEGARYATPPTWLQRSYTIGPPAELSTLAPAKQFSAPVRTTVKGLVTQMARECLSPELQTQGYKRKDCTFWRNESTVCKVIQLQMSRWGTASESSVGVSLGVYWHDVEVILRNGSRSMPPPVYLCTFQTHLGRLQPESVLPDWKVTLDSDYAIIGSDILRHLHEHGLPWLEFRSDLTNTTSVLRFPRPDGEGKWFYPDLCEPRAQAILHAKQGAVDKARDLLLMFKTNGQWGETERRIAALWGIE